MTASHTQPEIEMRKFNLEEAKSGKPVVTRLGRPVRILCWDAKGSDPIVGLIELDFTSYACNYNENGIFREGVESEQDLFMKSETKETTVTIESLTELASDLIAQNAELKNKIDALEEKLNNGIRVYALTDKQGYAFINHFGKGPRNATLLIDRGE